MILYILLIIFYLISIIAFKYLNFSEMLNQFFKLGNDFILIMTDKNHNDEDKEK